MRYVYNKALSPGCLHQVFDTARERHHPQLHLTEQVARAWVKRANQKHEADTQIALEISPALGDAQSSPYCPYGAYCPAKTIAKRLKGAGQ